MQNIPAFKFEILKHSFLFSDDDSNSKAFTQLTNTGNIQHWMSEYSCTYLVYSMNIFRKL